MKMRGLADQLVTWMLILLVIFTGTTLAQLDREQLLVQIRANISKINDGKTVSQNDTYLLLDHDYYFQEDFIDGAIDKDVLDKTIRPNFQMKLFGTEYDAVDVHANGAVLTQNSKERVIIEPLVNGFGGEYMHSVQTVKIIIVLYKNGIITMKYEEIPTGIDSKHLKSFFNQYCSKESSQEACSNASTPEIGCFWCEKHHACTNKFDKNAQIWYQNDCNNAVMNEQNKGNSLLSASNSNSTETTTTSPEKTSKQQQEATTNAVMNEQNKGNSLLSASNSNSTETTTTSPETSKQQQEATTRS
ncbi:plexin domain containing 2 precursor [Schistosoma japonicum]|nr:plexin domain containing 2 precursor [Schistosoma japonicum]